MFAVIDRFEGGFAVCETENRQMVNIERGKIPPEAREGDVLILGVTIIIDKKETARRKKEMELLAKNLWN